MAIIKWRGDAPAISQIWRYRVSGAVAEGTDLLMKINGKSIRAESPADTAIALLTAAAEAWEGSEIPEFAEVTATAGEDENEDAYLDLTADEAGKPFDVEITGPYPTIDVDTVQAGTDGVNEKQTITLNGTPTGGTYLVKWNPGTGLETSSAIAFDADADGVKAAIVAGMASLTDDDIEVTGTGVTGSPFVLEFMGAFAETNVAQVTVVSSLTGGGVVTVTQVQAGSQTAYVGGAFLDTFTASDLTDLDGKSTDTGDAEWDAHLSSEGNGDIVDDKLQVNGESQETQIWTIDTPSPSFVGSMELAFPAIAGNRAEFIVRYLDSSNYLRVGVNTTGSSTAELSIGRVQAGGNTDLDTDSISYTAGTEMTLSISVNGSAIAATCNGGSVSASSTFNNTSVKHGIRVFKSILMSDPEDAFTIDDFRLYSLVSNVPVDVFTGTDGTALTSHTTNSGHAWLKASRYDYDTASTAVIDGNALKVNVGYWGGGGGQEVYCSLSANLGLDFDATVDVVSTTSSSMSFGFLVRFIDNMNWVAAYVSRTAGSLILLKRDAGVGTTIATETGISYTADGRLSISVLGEDVTLTWTPGDGSSETVLEYSTDFLSDNQKHGLFTVGSSSHEVVYDNFVFTSQGSSQNEIQSVWTNGTGGTFTLTRPAGSTATGISATASTSALQTKLEGIYGAGDVLVTDGTGTEEDPWLVEFVGGYLGGIDLELMSGNGDGLIGVVTGVVATSQAGVAPLPMIQSIVLYGATGGTYQLEFKNKKTTALAYNANAATVQAALRALSSVGGTNMTVTGSGSEGSPFIVTLSGAFLGDQPQIVSHNESLTGDGPSITVEVIQASRGPHHVDDPLNYSSRAFPVDGDTFVATDSDVSMLYGLEILEEVLLAEFLINQSFTGDIGLDNKDQAGDYYQYRPKYLKVGATKLTVGSGEGGGSGLMKLDLGDEQSTINVLSTGQPSGQTFKSLMLKATHADNEINVIKGSVDIAPEEGDESAFAMIRVSYNENPSGDSDVRTGGGTTLVAIEQNGGTLSLASTTETIVQRDGDLTLLDGDHPSIVTTGGQIDWRTTGEIGALSVSNATVDLSHDPRPKDFDSASTIQLFRGASLRDPLGVLPDGVKIRDNTGGVELRFPPGKTYTVA